MNHWKLKIVLCAFSVALFAAHTASAATINKPTNYLGMVGYYTFDGADVTDKVYDRSGQGNNGGLYGVATSSAKTIGKIGQALDFDGVDDYAVVPDGNNAIDFTSGAPITLSTWVNSSNISTGYIGFFQKDLADTGAANFGMEIISGSSEATRTVDFFYVVDGAAGSYVECDTNSAVLPPNTWTHLAVSYIFASSTSIKFYANGESVGCTWVSGAGTEAPFVQNSPLEIGRTFNNQWLDGKLDEIRIYNRILSATEIKATYNSNAAKFNKSNTTAVASGLVGYWTLDGADVTDKVYDRSGQGNDGGFLGGATSSAKTLGKIGQALNFDGVDDYVNVPDPGSGVLDFGTATNFSVAAWVNVPASSPGQSFVTKAEDSNPPPGFDLHTSNFGDSGYTVRLLIDTAGGNCMVRGSSDIADGTWHYISAVVYRRASCTSNDILIFVDGVQQSGTVVTAAANTNADISSSEPLRIGAGENGGAIDYFTQGKIDEVRIYNRALSATEVKTLFNEGGGKMNASQNTQSTSGLVGLWSFDGKDVTDKVYDRSGAGNHGGFFGGATSSAKVIGKMGQALNFDAANDYVLNTTATGADKTKGTMTAWVYRTFADSTTNFPTAFSLAVDINNLVEVYYDSGGDSFVFHYFVGGLSHPINLLASQIPQNTWTYIVFTWDTGANSLRAYINGTFVDSATNNTAWSGTPDAIMVGTSEGLDPSASWQGKIDDFRLYNRALSATEIRQLYNIGR